MGALKKDWASPTSIALSWQQPEETTLPVLEYEVKYHEKVNECATHDYNGIWCLFIKYIYLRVLLMFLINCNCMHVYLKMFLSAYVKSSKRLNWNNVLLND